MDSFYQKLDNPKKIKLDEKWKGTPGGKIMDAMKGTKNFPNMFTRFCDFFHGKNNWTWLSGAKTPYGSAILDGEAKEGQCQALVRALRYLARAEAPYGLGLKEGQGLGEPTDGCFKGRFDLCFFSEHPIGGIHGLKSNVYKPLDKAPDSMSPLAPLRAWDNHWTLLYNGQYYDPSYRKIYDQLSAMAEYNAVLTDGSNRNETNIMQVESESGRTHFFIEIYNEQLSRRLNQVVPIYMGPYDNKNKVSSKLLALLSPRKDCCCIIS